MGRTRLQIDAVNGDRIGSAGRHLVRERELARIVNVADGSTIRQFAIATPASGGLTLANTLTTLNGLLVALKSDPTGRLLVSATDTGVVETYLLNAAGLPVAPVPVDSLALAPVTSITFDLTGRFVYFTHSSGAYLSAYAVTPDGHLQLIGTPWMDYPAVSATLHPSGKYYYATSPVAKYTMLYVVNAASGILRPSAIYTAMKSGHVAASADGRFLYVSNQNTPGTQAIARFDLTATGGMLPRGSVTLQGAAIADLKFEVDPSNLYLYALTGDRLETYSIDQATGDLAFASSTPIGHPGIFALSNAK